MSSPAPLLQGTLDLLILKALSLGEMHGLGIARRVNEISGGAFEVRPGSLFPALHRMERAGWLDASWGTSENNRRAKYYRLRRAGVAKFAAEVEQWERTSGAIALALQTT